MTDSSPQSPPAATQEPKRSRVLQWEPLSLSHIIQISLGVAVTLSVLRLSAVAEGNVPLAVGIILATSYVAPLIQMALFLVPTFIFLAAVYLLHYRRLAKRAHRDNVVTRYIWIYLVWAFVLLAFITPWVVLMIGVAAVALIQIPGYVRDRRVRRQGIVVSDEAFRHTVRRQIVTVGVVVVTFFILGSILNPQPWLPEEKVTTASGSTNGYVLDVTTQWTTVLVDNPRYLKYVKTEDVLSRTVCAPTENKTLIQLLPYEPEGYLAPPGC